MSNWVWFTTNNVMLELTAAASYLFHYNNDMPHTPENVRDAMEVLMAILGHQVDQYLIPEITNRNAVFALIDAYNARLMQIASTLNQLDMSQSNATNDVQKNDAQQKAYNALIAITTEGISDEDKAFYDHWQALIYSENVTIAQLEACEADLKAIKSASED